MFPRIQVLRSHLEVSDSGSNKAAKYCISPQMIVMVCQCKDFTSVNMRAVNPSWLARKISVFITISTVQMTERTRPQSILNTYLKLLIKDTVQEEQESRGNYRGSQMLAITALLKWSLFHWRAGLCYREQMGDISKQLLTPPTDKCKGDLSAYLPWEVGGAPECRAPRCTNVQGSPKEVARTIFYFLS